jgi:hypothetical protein
MPAITKAPRTARRSTTAATRSSTPASRAAVRHGRRRMIDPTTCERDYQPEEVEFMQALDLYKRASGRMFPTCSEVLEVFKSLGYRREIATAG